MNSHILPSFYFYPTSFLLLPHGVIEIILKYWKIDYSNQKVQVRLALYRFSVSTDPRWIWFLTISNRHTCSMYFSYLNFFLIGTYLMVIDQMNLLIANQYFIYIHRTRESNCNTFTNFSSYLRWFFTFHNRVSGFKSQFIIKVKNFHIQRKIINFVSFSFSLWLHYSINNWLIIRLKQQTGYPLESLFI